MTIDHGRLDMSVGEAIFTQRSIRRFRPDAIPLPDLQLIFEAAVRAPNGGNRLIGRRALPVGVRAGRRPQGHGHLRSA